MENPVNMTKEETCNRAQIVVWEDLRDTAFMKIFNASSDLITISSWKDDTLIDANESVLRVTGYERCELVGRSLSGLGLWPTAGNWARLAADLLRGPIRDVEVTFLTKSGQRRTGFMLAEPIQLGGHEYLLTVVRDSTDGKQTAARLGRLSAVVEQSSEAVLITGLDGTIAYANPAFAEITGYSREEAVGRNPRFLKSGKQDTQLYKSLWDTILGGKIWHGEMTNRRRDGSLYLQETTIIPVQGERDEPSHFIAIGLDVTAQRTTEEQLRQAQKMESIGRLAGGVAHDFNNLLTVIIGYGQLLQDSLPADSPLQAYCSEVLGAGQRAAVLTRQLLAFSRRQVLAPQVLDLNSVVDNLEKMLRRLIGEDIELITIHGNGLARVKADAGQIEQVIVNLAVNARDAMPQGGRLTVETANVSLDEHFCKTHRGASAGPQVMLSVSDTGVGMDAKIMTHLFEPFFTTKEKGKGTGLGLATVYGIVKQSAGSIWAYSEPGHGSRFKIYLPRCEEAIAEIGQAKNPSLSTRGCETILVVEDERGLRSLVCKALSAQGYKVLEAEGSLPAASATYAYPLHLLLTDVVMPQMSGKALASCVTALHPETKVLYMSGYTDDAVVRHGIQESNAFFLQKPFTTGVLARKVREVLDKNLQNAQK
jgi:two-component system cell cycle sensor histidine kinase/response regulator CckA